MTYQTTRIFWKFIYLLGNLRLAIFLLLLIASVSSLGTIIEQEKNISFYETTYPLSKPIAGFINSDFILFLGLDHVYTTNWFLILLFLFSASLLSCTLSRQIPSLKLATIWKFFKSEKKANKSGITFNITGLSINQFTYALRERNYNIVQQGPYLYAYRGLIGKIGPILVHLSITLIMVGSVIGALTGFMTQELVTKGELFHLQNVVASGPLSYIRQDFEGYIHDFNIAYNDQGLVDQFYSDISILDNNLESISKKTIFVNEPLRSQGSTFYQTDWSVTKLKVRLNGINVSDVLLKEISTSNNSRFWIGSFNIKQDKLILVLQDLTGKYLVYSPERKLLGQSEIGHKIFLNGTQLRLESIVPSTGIQVKSDPGVPFVYIGFFFLIFSITLSYTSYCQIWAVKVKKKVYIYGNTNRASYFFEKDILEIVDLLQAEKIKIEEMQIS
jgi:cytochrome c biogenesis protein|uniref:c-type cytochrome biogenensis protein n=1 Tax=Cryptomonas pyrenoidifera TaxID=233184 RepID=UPI0022A6F472|nr:c-type cytochrome biogenensis protein [Cryptomonas pyrenoidifera]UZS90573.1 c-type cytochrome biogenensis protein [Cryptomonas pyrenoidifera]